MIRLPDDMEAFWSLTVETEEDFNMDEKLSNMPEQDQNSDTSSGSSYQQTTNYGYYGGEGEQENSGANNGTYQQNFNQNYNQGYQQNYNMNQGKKPLDAPLSMGEWLLMILAGFLPCVGIILYCIWAFSSNTNINRKNFSRAMLIVMVVVILLNTVFLGVFGAAMTSALYY